MSHPLSFKVRSINTADAAAQHVVRLSSPIRVSQGCFCTAVERKAAKCMAFVPFGIASAKAYGCMCVSVWYGRPLAWTVGKDLPHLLPRRAAPSLSSSSSSTFHFVPPPTQQLHDLDANGFTPQRLLLGLDLTFTRFPLPVGTAHQESAPWRHSTRKYWQPTSSHRCP